MKNKTKTEGSPGRLEFDLLMVRCTSMVFITGAPTVSIQASYFINPIVDGERLGAELAEAIEVTRYKSVNDAGSYLNRLLMEKLPEYINKGMARVTEVTEIKLIKHVTSPGIQVEFREVKPKRQAPNMIKIPPFGGRSH
jgi:hypothetical protein